MTKNKHYTRVLLKLSGEMLKNDSDCICKDKILHMISNIKQITSLGIELALVIGGGNIFRGYSGVNQGIDRINGDYMGMLATCINALALKDSLNSMNIETRVLSAISMRQISEPYIRERALSHLKKNIVIIFSSGTGNPYFSTDTTAALRANEINAQILLKGTNVDGVYDKDPKKFSNAKKLPMLSYNEVIERDIKVMDQTAFTLCKENNLPIVIFDIMEQGTLNKILNNDFSSCTIIR